MKNRCQEVKFNLMNLLKISQKNGFFHVIISSTLVKIISFMSSIFLPRFLDKGDFGLLAYVDNLLGYFLLINGLGMVNATIRYCTSTDSLEKRNGIFRTTLIIGLIFDFFLMIGIFVIVYFSNFMSLSKSNLLLWLLFIPPLTFIFEDIQLFLRAIFKNKAYSVLSTLYTIFMVTMQIGFSILFSLKGVVLGRYIALILSIIVGITSIKKYKESNTQVTYPSKNEIVKMMKYSFIVMLGNSLSLIIQLNEITLLNIFSEGDLIVADYKIATYIFSITFFFTQSILLFVYPYFIKNKDNVQWVKSNYKKLFIGNLLLSIPVHIILFIFSKYIIILLFGSTYLTANTIMRILIVASFVQVTFRSIPGSILTGIGYEKFNLRINILTTVIHFFMNYYLLWSYGPNTAGIALIVVYILSGLALNLKVLKMQSDRR